MPVLAAAPDADPVRYKGVTVEANYDVGEYDVSILSAKESDGLTNWLTDNGYTIPQGAEAVLGSYIKQNMRFFVAKVNLERMTLIGGNYLRPLQVRYDTPKFMLPLRLGTVNANGPQDLIIYALTKNGRVEAANYRTVKLPSDMDVPLFVKNDFGNFYKALFDQAVKKENMRAVFVEYAWDMGWCDPCAADPLSSKQLVELGARWITDDGDKPFRGRMPQGANAYVTRLHVRYDAKTFPEDLVFIETKDRSNFQGRYVLRHPFKGATTCDAGRSIRPPCRRASSRKPQSRPAHRLEAERDRDADGGRRAEREGRGSSAPCARSDRLPLKVVRTASGMAPSVGQPYPILAAETPRLKRTYPSHRVADSYTSPAIGFTSPLPGNTFAASA